MVYFYILIVRNALTIYKVFHRSDLLKIVEKINQNLTHIKSFLNENKLEMLDLKITFFQIHFLELAYSYEDAKHNEEKAKKLIEKNDEL